VLRSLLRADQDAGLTEPKTVERKKIPQHAGFIGSIDPSIFLW
jgi:hypothetical protein